MPLFFRSHVLHSTLIDSLFLKASKFDWFLLEFYIALSEILLTVSQGINLLFPIIWGGGVGGGPCDVIIFLKEKRLNLIRFTTISQGYILGCQNTQKYSYYERCSYGHVSQSYVYLDDTVFYISPYSYSRMKVFNQL